MTGYSTDAKMVAVKERGNVKLLTKNSDYAIRALIALQETKDNFLPAREISESQNIPYQYLRGILTKLIKNGFVESREGLKGGFKIKKSTGKASIADVIRIFQGDIQLTECMFRENICGNKATCVLRKEISKVEKIVADEFSGITLEKLSKKLKKEA